MNQVVLKMEMLTLSGLFILFITTQVNGQIGNSCNIRSENNAPGSCVLFKECPKALADFQRQKFPQVCGYQGTVPIVCCAKVSKAVGDISKEKCREYGRAVYQFEIPPTFDIDVVAVNRSTCAIKVIPLVIGGEKAESAEFPHMALLGYGEQNDIAWKCGGSLISDKFVLTAGHCLHARDFGPVRWIRLGDLNIKRTNDKAAPEEFGALKLIRFPEYKPPSQYNDIGLIELSRNVKFNRYIRPACLHTTMSIPTTRYIASGWGLTEFGGSKGSDDLLKVVLDSFSQTECNSSYENNISERRLKYGIIPESQVCAGGTDSEKDTCQGDSGGPLQIFHKQVDCMYSIVGVTSFGKTCGAIGVPGVYTRVSNYIKWIEETVWPGL